MHYYRYETIAPSIDNLNFISNPQYVGLCVCFYYSTKIRKEYIRKLVIRSLTTKNYDKNDTNWKSNKRLSNYFLYAFSKFSLNQYNVGYMNLFLSHSLCWVFSFSFFKLSKVDDTPICVFWDFDIRYIFIYQGYFCSNLCIY